MKAHRLAFAALSCVTSCGEPRAPAASGVAPPPSIDADAALGTAGDASAPTAVEHGRSGWGLLASPSRKGAKPVVQWELIHHRDGAQTRAVLFEVDGGGRASGRSLDEEAGAPVCESVTTFDFDGDGVPEAFPVCSGLSDDPVGPRTLWTFKDGEVRPYAPAAGIDVRSLRDVDGDGRPDLEYTYFHGVVRHYIADPIAFPTRSALLIAHSLPNGDFSRTDAVAMKHARAQCPARPGKLLTQNVDEMSKRVSCARMWGVPKATVLSTIKRECDAFWKGRSKEDGREHDPCLSGGLLELSASDPPLVLK